MIASLRIFQKWNKRVILCEMNIFIHFKKYIISSKFYENNHFILEYIKFMFFNLSELTKNEWSIIWYRENESKQNFSKVWRKSFWECIPTCKQIVIDFMKLFNQMFSESDMEHWIRVLFYMFRVQWYVYCSL